MAAAPPDPLAFGGGAVRSGKQQRRAVIEYGRSSSAKTLKPKNEKVYKELGLFSLKKRIQDAVNRAEILALTELEFNESRRIQLNKVFHELNLWDDASTSDASLYALTDAVKVVNDIKDMRYKAEEAKLITDLAEMDFITDVLFELAYKASIEVSKFLNHYEICKLLRGPYDKEGACLVVNAEEGLNSKIWAEKLLCMYINWAEKHGYIGRVLEKYPSKGGGISSSTIEFESDYAFGYLSGERGVHKMIQSYSDSSVVSENSSASVDVMPLFLEGTPDFDIEDKDLEVSFPVCTPIDDNHITELGVSVKHIPSGIRVQSSGERSHFANRFKALNRLKGKLLVLAAERVQTEENKVNGQCTEERKYEVRRYIFHPRTSVQDMKTGIQLPDLNSILNGDIESFLRGHISLRYGR